MKNKKRFIALLAVFALVLAVMPQVTFAGTFASNFEAQLNPDVNAEIGEWTDMSAFGTFPDFDYNQPVTISLNFGAPVAFGGNYAAVNTNVPIDEYTGAEITSFKIDGNEISIGPAFLNSEGITGGLRLTICNKWNSDIDTQPYDVATIGEFTTLEVTFIVHNDSAPAPLAEAIIPISADIDQTAAGGGSNPQTGDNGILAFAAAGLAAVFALVIIRKKAASIR